MEAKKSGNIIVTLKMINKIFYNLIKEKKLKDIYFKDKNINQVIQTKLFDCGKFLKKTRQYLKKF